MNLESAAKRTAKIREQFASEVDTARADKLLSDEGRRQKIARSYLRADTAAAKISADIEAVEENSRTLLERTLFRPQLPLGATPSDRIAADASFRDALDRAVATDPDDDSLAQLMHRSTITGDAIQARAVLAVAADRADLDAAQCIRRGASSDRGRLAEVYRSLCQALDQGVARSSDGARRARVTE